MRRAVRNAILDAEPQKPRERQAVAHLILNLFVGQIVKRLQHQHPKHNNDINRLAAGVALLFTPRRQCRRFNLGAEALERHHPINHLKRITLRGNHREPLVRIKKTELTHRTHIPESYCDSQTRTNSGRPLFFEVPLRLLALTAVRSGTLITTPLAGIDTATRADSSIPAARM